MLFRSVKGHDIPLLTNLLASESRICRALGVETIEEAIGRVDRVLNSSAVKAGWKGFASAQKQCRREFCRQSRKVRRLPADRPFGQRCRPGRTSLPAGRR